MTSNCSYITFLVAVAQYCDKSNVREKVSPDSQFGREVMMAGTEDWSLHLQSGRRMNTWVSLTFSFSLSTGSQALEMY